MRETTRRRGWRLCNRATLFRVVKSETVDLAKRVDLTIFPHPRAVMYSTIDQYRAGDGKRKSLRCERAASYGEYYEARSSTIHRRELKLHAAIRIYFYYGPINHKISSLLDFFPNSNEGI